MDPAPAAEPPQPHAPEPAAGNAMERVVHFATAMPKEVMTKVINAPDLLVSEAVKKAAPFRPRGLIVCSMAFCACVLIGVGLVSRVGQVNTVAPSGATINAYATLWTVCSSTTVCRSSSSANDCSTTSSCADPASFDCAEESRRYFIARCFYVVAILVNVVLAIIGALDALRRLPGNLPGGVSLRGIMIMVSVAAAVLAVLGFIVALATWFGVHCGPAVSNVPGAQPGRGPFLALLGAMASAVGTTSAWVTRTRFEVMQEEAARAADANGVVTLTAAQATPVAVTKKVKRRKWLYDDPDDFQP